MRKIVIIICTYSSPIPSSIKIFTRNTTASHRRNSKRFRTWTWRRRYYSAPWILRAKIYSDARHEGIFRSGRKACGWMPGHPDRKVNKHNFIILQRGNVWKAWLRWKSKTKHNIYIRYVKYFSLHAVGLSAFHDRICPSYKGKIPTDNISLLLKFHSRRKALCCC